MNEILQEATPIATCPRLIIAVGQSGGCTPVMNASLVGVVAEGQRLRARAIYGFAHGVEGLLQGRWVDLTRLAKPRLDALALTPAAALGSCRYRPTRDEIAAIIRRLRRRSVNAFIYIGGNDSAETSHRIARAAAGIGYPLRVIGAPKTIDNDLPDMDHTPGFGSVARFVAAATRDAGRDTESMHTIEPVKLIEVMGRNAGWIAAASVLAKESERDAPQFIWPPELPYDEERFLAAVRRWLRRIGYCVVVVAEAIRDARSRPVAARGRRLMTDAFGHPRLVGAAEYLCERVRVKLGVSARWDKAGTIQRMSALHLSSVDVAEARAAGQAAVAAAAAGHSDAMVTLLRRPGRRYRCVTGLTPLGRIARAERRLPDEYLDRRVLLPTVAFRNYALPLIGPPLRPHPRLS